MMNTDRVTTTPEQLALFASCGTDEDQARRAERAFSAACEYRSRRPEWCMNAPKLSRMTARRACQGSVLGFEALRLAQNAFTSESGKVRVDWCRSNANLNGGIAKNSAGRADGVPRSWRRVANAQVATDAGRNGVMGMPVDSVAVMIHGAADGGLDRMRGGVVGRLSHGIR
jgi:hypothetical protein